MNDAIFLITEVVLFFNLLVYYIKYKYKSLLHPGFYFALIWIVGVPSQRYLIQNNIALTPNLIFVDELNLFIAYTSLMFTLATLFFKLPKLTSTDKVIELDYINIKVFYILNFISLSAALLKLIYSIVFLGVSLNMGETRQLYVYNLQQIFRPLQIIEYIFSYLLMFHPLLQVMAGYFIGRNIARQNKFAISTIHLLIPAIVTILLALSIGGRNPIAEGIKLYLLGIALSIPIKLASEQKYKIIITTLLLFLSFTVFTTYVADQRTMVSGSHSVNSDRIRDPLLKPFAGIMEYISASYWGYQLRRIDTFDSDNLGYGSYTFYGIYLLQIPFGNIVGLDLNIGDIIGISPNPLSYIELSKARRIGFYTPSTIFADIICDFGEIGSLIFLTFFVFYTQWLYLSIFSKKHTNIFSIFFFFLSFVYWSNSNFNSIYANSLYIYAIVFISFHFINKKKNT